MNFTVWLFGAVLLVEGEFFETAMAVHVGVAAALGIALISVLVTMWVDQLDPAIVQRVREAGSR